MDCIPLGSSVHGILQTIILEWVAISFSREYSWPRNQTRSPALQADSLPSEPLCLNHNYAWIRVKPRSLELWTHAWLSRFSVSCGSASSSDVMEYDFMISPWCDQCKTYMHAVGTVHLKMWKKIKKIIKIWKTKGWPCKSRLSQKAVLRTFFWEAKKSQLPLHNNPENRCHH